MAAATLNLVGEAAIEQGAYWSLWIYYPGMVQSARLRAQMRPGFDGTVLAEFRFDQGIYDSQANRTGFKMWLSSGQTKKLTPAPDNAPYRYDVLFYGSTGEPDRILQGIVEISPGVTE